MRTRQQHSPQKILITDKPGETEIDVQARAINEAAITIKTVSEFSGKTVAEIVDNLHKLMRP